MVSAPALPAFKFSRLGERQLGRGLEISRQPTRVGFEGLAQGGGCSGGGLAVAKPHLALQCLHQLLYRLTSRRWLGRVWGGFASCDSGGFGRFTAQYTQLIGPCGYTRQRQVGVCCGGFGLRQSGIECIPHKMNVLRTFIEDGGVFGVDALPVSVLAEGVPFGIKAL